MKASFVILFSCILLLSTCDRKKPKDQLTTIKSPTPSVVAPSQKAARKEVSIDKPLIDNKKNILEKTDRGSRPELNNDPPISLEGDDEVEGDQVSKQAIEQQKNKAKIVKDYQTKKTNPMVGKHN